MEQTLDPQSVYNELLNGHNKSLFALRRKGTILGWLRLTSILLLIAVFYFLWSANIALLIIAAAICVAFFLILVNLDQDNKEKISHTESLVSINNQELLINAHQFVHRNDGAQYAVPNHEYAQDLDIFGRSSLFQYLNRANTEQGMQIFARWLTSPSETATITERQEAAQELSALVPTLQNFQASTLKSPLTDKGGKNIEAWTKQPPRFSARYWQLLRWFVPIFSTIWIIFFSKDKIPAPLFNIVLAILFFSGLLISRKVMQIHDQLGKINAELSTMESALQIIEQSNFKSDYLKKLSAGLGKDDKPASVIIKNLNQVLNRMDYRLNPLVFIPLNTLVFWDLQQVLPLENWKKKYGNLISAWFSLIGEFEAIGTLGTFYFNHPDYCTPHISDKPGIFDATDLGHPLIRDDKRVASSFSTCDIKQISIITGSNMGGKSTFLRSVGINIVLSMMGAKVCAHSLTVSHQKVVSSMRITDNLEENTSTFYAELKKLKQIIDRVNNHEEVFLLLDEILRGTNSQDRHIGSKALIKQLLAKGAVGIIATHDLELAKLSDDFPQNIKNYHFDVQVENEELYFDYKLKNGVCQSMNASILMKKIGISL